MPAAPTRTPSWPSTASRLPHPRASPTGRRGRGRRSPQVRDDPLAGGVGAEERADVRGREDTLLDPGAADHPAQRRRPRDLHERPEQSVDRGRRCVRGVVVVGSGHDNSGSGREALECRLPVTTSECVDHSIEHAVRPTCHLPPLGFHPDCPKRTTFPENWTFSQDPSDVRSRAPRSPRRVVHRGAPIRSPGIVRVDQLVGQNGYGDPPLATFQDSHVGSQARQVAGLGRARRRPAGRPAAPPRTAARGGSRGPAG